MNSAAYRKKKASIMDPEAMDRLLGILDSDLGAAVRKLDKTRSRLTNLFRWRGCPTPDQYAAKTIEVAARRLFECEELQLHNPSLHFNRLAINQSHLWKELLRKRDTGSIRSVDRAPYGVAAEPATPPESESGNMDRERLVQCLRACLGALEVESLELITRYHQPGETRREARQELARSLGISQAALRIRAFRIRSDLERSVTNCLGDSKAD
jgi:hypothetical protein